MVATSSSGSAYRMKRKVLFYLVLFIAFALVLGSSVEFRRLDQKRAEERARQFDPADYARDFWDNRLDGALAGALDTAELIRLFNTDMNAAVRQGQTLGQSRVHAYLLAGEGKIVELEKDGLLVSVLPENPNPEVLICTGSYISGNAVRDASGLIDVSTFSDTMKFNRISSEINRLAVQEVIVPFVAAPPRVGATVRFVGAAEVAEEATTSVPFGGRKVDGGQEDSWHLLRIVPVRLELN